MGLSDGDRMRIARQFIEAIPFSSALAMRLDRLEQAMAEISMPWSEVLVGDPGSGVIHGGAVSALMDTCGGAAVMATGKTLSTATIDLRIDYMRAATPGERVVARAECYHLTRSVAFVRARAWDNNAEEPVATAAAAFTVEGGGR
ncbi:MAG: PaaI family thioesterase [Pseudomonadota bacterium]